MAAMLSPPFRFMLWCYFVALLNQGNGSSSAGGDAEFPSPNEDAADDNSHLHMAQATTAGAESVASGGHMISNVDAVDLKTNFNSKGKERDPVGNTTSASRGSESDGDDDSVKWVTIFVDSVASDVIEETMKVCCASNCWMFLCFFSILMGRR